MRRVAVDDRHFAGASLVDANLLQIVGVRRRGQRGVGIDVLARGDEAHGVGTTGEANDCLVDRLQADHHRLPETAFLELCGE